MGILNRSETVIEYTHGPSGVTFQTNDHLHGFWIAGRQRQGTAQRRFSTVRAFRRYAARYARTYLLT